MMLRSWEVFLVPLQVDAHRQGHQGSGACETSGVPVELQGWKGGLWVV